MGVGGSRCPQRDVELVLETCSENAFTYNTLFGCVISAIDSGVTGSPLLALSLSLPRSPA
jgi:hypothetical protein